MSNADVLKAAMLNAIEIAIRDHLSRAYRQHDIKTILGLTGTDRGNVLIRNMAEGVRDALATVAYDTSIAEQEAEEQETLKFSISTDSLFCSNCSGINGEHTENCKHSQSYKAVKRGKE